MPRTAPAREAIRRGGPLQAARRALFLGLLGASVAAYGASVTGAFNVRVDLSTNDKAAVQCERELEATGVRVKCDQLATPARPRVLLHVLLGNGAEPTVDSTLATGTVTSWRVVRGAGRDYVEIVVGW